MKRARELAVAPALVLALGIGSLVAVTGCEGGDDDALEQADGSLQGELAIYMADDLERGVQTKQYAIRSAPGVERRVEFDSDPGLQGTGQFAITTYVSGTATNGPIGIGFDHLSVVAPN